MQFAAGDLCSEFATTARSLPCVHACEPASQPASRAARGPTLNVEENECFHLPPSAAYRRPETLTLLRKQGNGEISDESISHFDCKRRKTTTDDSASDRASRRSPPHEINSQEAYCKADLKRRTAPRQSRSSTRGGFKKTCKGFFPLLGAETPNKGTLLSVLSCHPRALSRERSVCTLGRFAVHALRESLRPFQPRTPVCIVRQSDHSSFGLSVCLSACRLAGW